MWCSGFKELYGTYVIVSVLFQYGCMFALESDLFVASDM